MAGDDRPRNGKGQYCKREDGDGEARQCSGPSRSPSPSAGPKPRKRGSKARGGATWNREKEAIFFRELAMVCNVTSALRKAKLLGSSSDAYERRKKDARFAADWAEAIEQSYTMLELEMLERTRFGKDRPPPANEAEKRLREIPDRLALQLLRLHQNRARATPAGPAAARPGGRVDGDSLLRKIDRLLADMNRRMGGEG